MFFLAGSAASSALDIIATLQKTLGTKPANASNSPTPGGPPSNASTFDASASTSAGPSNSSSSTGTNAPNPLIAPSTLDALLAVQGQGNNLVVNGDAFSQQLFSLLDTNGDGSVSKSEFETAFGANGNTTKADQIFSRIDANGDGSISASELTDALDGHDNGQHEGVEHARHHHHDGFGEFGGPGGLGISAGGHAGSNASGANPLDLVGASSQNVTNSDGSTTTTITYADGSKVALTVPAASNSGSGTGTGSSTGNTANNFIERIIERQAQLLAASSVGQSLAVSA